MGPGHRPDHRRGAERALLGRGLVREQDGRYAHWGTEQVSRHRGLLDLLLAWIHARRPNACRRSRYRRCVCRTHRRCSRALRGPPCPSSAGPARSSRELGRRARGSEVVPRAQAASSRALAIATKRSMLACSRAADCKAVRPLAARKPRTSSRRPDLRRSGSRPTDPRLSRRRLREA